ncbi:MAG TPA: glycosyltransferase [Pyrinomonadaceae bacterium]|nr:glycosyltransferase [Pyrinomonadaceae bacterium]
MNPKMSVLVITYNHEKYIRQALDSVLMQQQDFDVEVIIADDFSQDSTRDIARQYETQVQNVTLLPSDQNVGITKNLRRGLAACRGKYIALIEGDDFWISPKKLSIVGGFLDDYPECSFCFHRLIKVDETSDTASVHPMIESPNEFKMFTASDLARVNIVGGLSTCTYRRAVIDNLDPGLWDLKVREWPFNIVVALQGSFAYIPEILSVYRAHWGGIFSKKSLAEKTEILLQIIETYNRYLEFRFDEEFKEFKGKLLKTHSGWGNRWLMKSR